MSFAKSDGRDEREREKKMKASKESGASMVEGRKVFRTINAKKKISQRMILTDSNTKQQNCVAL